MSLISLAVLSYERYSTLTLCNKRSTDYQKALLAVGGSWIYSLVWTVPPLIGWSSYGVEGAGTSCSVRWSSESAKSISYVICLFIFCLVIPVMVMMYCYGRLLYTVKQVSSWVLLIVQTVLRCMLHFPSIKFGNIDDSKTTNHNEIEKATASRKGQEVFTKLYGSPEEPVRATR